MEINLGEERVVELKSTFTEEQVRGLALARRVDAFGQMARLFQRPKPEDIEIASIQKRFEPFWRVTATSHYAYDRRRSYRIEVAPEVRAVTIQGVELPAADARPRTVEFEAVDHCVEDDRREMLLDATQGEERAELRKYMTYESAQVDDMAALGQNDAVVVSPTVMSSFVVRKLVTAMMKTFHADAVLEERIDIEQVALYYRPLYAVEYFWKARDRRQVLEFDALTGDVHAEATVVKRHMMRVLDNDALFDIGADTMGMLVPGSGIAIKVTRLAARRALH